MAQIFGTHTARVMTYLGALSDLSCADVRTVAQAWRDTDVRQRAEAWVRIHRTLTEEERLPVLAAASVARQDALDIARRYGGPDWPFWAAASDAAAGIAAGDRIGCHQLTLVAPLATVMAGVSLSDGWIRARRTVHSIGATPDVLSRGA